MGTWGRSADLPDVGSHPNASEVTAMPRSTACPSCTSTDLLSVVLEAKGTPMRFTTCRHCERRWWEDIEQGTDLQLDEVLAQVAG
jgi:transcription elongation factor Elf1